MIVDFAVIGAQKSGTTALFKYFEKHPDLILPSNKEAPYFVQSHIYKNQNFCEYFSIYYGGRNEKNKNALIGSISPQYMCYEGCARRMYKHNPNMKIIAILREPISRSISHYKMNVRRGIEDRDINEVLERSLSGNMKLPMYEENERLNERASVLLWSLYGTALKPFFGLFKDKDILILRQDELVDNPGGLYNRICNFLKIDNKYIPANLGKRYHVGGDSTYLPRSEEWAKFKLLKKIWHILPQKSRVKISYWYDIYNIKSGGNSSGYEIEESILKKTVALVKKDSQEIARLQEFIRYWYGNV